MMSNIPASQMVQIEPDCIPVLSRSFGAVPTPTPTPSPGPGPTPTPSPDTDPYWDDVVFYAPLNSTSPPDDVIDDYKGHTGALSGSGQAAVPDVTAIGGYTFQIGNWAGGANFNGCIEVYPPDQGYAFNGDFTVELMANIQAVGKFGTEGQIIGQGLYGTQTPWALRYYSDSQKLVASLYNSTEGQVQITSSINLTLGVYHSLALTRQGTTVYLFIDGAVVGTGTMAGALPLITNLFIGEISYGALGYYNQVRITNGVARYTANYTPATGPFPTS